MLRMTGIQFEEGYMFERYRGKFLGMDFKDGYGKEQTVAFSAF